MALVSLGVALLLGAPAGLILGGSMLVFIGSATDDQAVTASLRRGLNWCRFLWYRQLARENGVPVPDLRAQDLPCDCRGQDLDCPLCMGSGWMPNPNLRGESPHPAIRVDPEAQASAARLARMREGRAKSGDRTAALSRN